jgi:CRISPR system Cascade subunit CasE
MFFSRVQIKLCEEALEYLGGLAKDDSYATHQLLWNLFPQDPAAKRDFLYRAEQKEGWPVYYVLSKREPVALSNLFSINKKIYEPVITEGLQLKFDIRANPVVARKVDGKKNGVHHDVLMDAKKKAMQEELSEAEAEQLKKEYSIKWLVDRSVDAGFTIDVPTLRIDAYRQHRALKKSVKPLQYSTVDYSGSLTVTDVEKFKNTLFSGLGRSKAFGCGLLLIKPV